MLLYLGRKKAMEANTQEIKLTSEEEQFINDEPWKYAAYSSPVTASELLTKVQHNFSLVPSYVEQQAQAFVRECDALGITSVAD